MLHGFAHKLFKVSLNTCNMWLCSFLGIITYEYNNLNLGLQLFGLFLFQMKTSNKSTCGFCNKIFNNKSNCNRHVRTVHKVNSKGNLEDQSIICCSLCEKKFSQKSSLQRHMKTVHTSTDLKVFKCPECSFLSRYKDSLKTHMVRHKRKQEIVHLKKYGCSLCDAKYSSKLTLNCHEKKMHSKKPLTKIERKCPICSFVSKDLYKKDMYSHFEKTHEIQLQWEEHSFPSEEEFLKWKSEVERQSIASFVKSHGKREHIQHFKCHRYGKQNIKRQNKRHSKLMKSCNMNAFCPASMKVTLKSKNEISVMFLKTHVGHENELRHKRLTAVERNIIANQLKLKKPHEEILKDVRDSISNCELQRIHLLNKKDINNIERSFNLGNEAIQQPFDPVSISVWVETLKTSANATFESFESSLDKYTLELNKMIKENVQNLEELKFVKNYMAGLIPPLNALKSNTTSTLNPVDKAPANSNLVKKKIFLSTMKNKKIEKPHDDPDQIILSVLKS